MTSSQRKAIAITFPELAQQLEQKARDEFLLNEIKRKAERGEKGESIIGPQGPAGKNGESIIGPQGIQGVAGPIGLQGAEGKSGKSIVGPAGKDGRDGSPDTPESIASKLNTLKGAVDISVIKGAVTRDEIKEISSGMAKVGGRIKLIDQRWGAHGGGLSRVYTDATLTGTGVQSSPLSVVGGIGTIYTETPAGLIDGVNVTYTTVHTMATILGFFINGQFIHPAEYSAVGTTITFVTALPAGLSGTGFTIIYA